MTNPLSSLPPKQKGIIYILITAAVITAVWYLVKETRAYFRRNKERKNPQEVVNDSKQELQNAQASGQTLSSLPSEYKSTANTLEKLLDGCETASSELDVVQNIIKVVKKPIDWANLKVEFGVREISQCGSFGMIKDSYDLPTLLKDQLDSSGLYTINVDGYKASGFAFETINILRDYFNTIGITI